MRTFFYLLVASIGLGLSSPARAADDEPAVDPANQELIQQGIALRHGGKDEAALAVFLEAERRTPTSVRVLLHVTAAAQATGRWLMAHEYLQKASAYRNDPYYQRYRASIKAVEDTVLQHVGQFRVLGSPAGAEVLLNGEKVANLPMSAAKMIEVGSYVLEVRKTGYYPLRRPLSIGGGAALTQAAVELKQREASSALASDRRAADGDGLRGASAKASPLESRWITWTLAGTGAALAVTSGVALAIREGAASRWNDDSRCLEGTLTREQVCGDVRQDAESAERVGVVTGVLALGFGAASLTHWLWTKDGSRGERQVGGFRASCDAGLGSVLCHGSF